MTGMLRLLVALRGWALGQNGPDRVVPGSGLGAWLTALVSAVMGFLAVVALVMAMAANRLADRWDGALSQVATVQVTGPAEVIDARTGAALDVLRQTPGVAEARALSREEIEALVSPWIGRDLPQGSVPLPSLIEVTPVETAPYDATTLRQALSEAVPGAALDDHSRWSQPIAEAADRLRVLAAVVLFLIALATAALVTLATGAAMTASAPVIAVLRQLGALDSYIVAAFVRRFTLRTALGAAAGGSAAAASLALFPKLPETGAFVASIGLSGADWLILAIVPLVAGAIALLATRIAAFARLRRLP